MKRIENVVIGAGPAGLQAAHFLAQRGEEYVVVERSDHPGAFFDAYPRHRKLLSINKRFTGCPDRESRLRYDWNSLLGDEDCPMFTDYARDYFPSADAIPRYLQDYATHHRLEIRYGVEVERVERLATGLRIAIAGGESIECRRLFVATGLSRENLPEIEGVELCDRYSSMEVDPDAFTDQRVMIVGKGNSAFETAQNLIETTQKIWVCGPQRVRLAWATHYVGDVRAINNDFLDTYQLKAQNNILDGELSSVRKNASGTLTAEVYFESRRRSYRYECDRVILCTGFRLDTSIFAEDCQPEMHDCGRLPLLNCDWESTNVSGLYFVGTLMQSRDYRRTMSAFIHGFRHNVRALDRILEARSLGRWPATQHLPRDSSALARALIERLSTSAAMLLQPGFLGDVVLTGRSGEEAQYLEDVPVDYARERLLPKSDTMYVATLEYKEMDGNMDPFAMPRGVGVTEDYYLHPVIRRYAPGQATARVFLPDDLDNDWRNEPEHFSRLRASFAEELGEVRTAPAHSFVAELAGRSDVSGAA